MRWFNQQQESGPWDAVAQITSAIMQRNQQRAQEKKDLQSTQSLFGLLQPSDVDTGTGMRSQVNFDHALQSVRGEQPKRLFDFAKIGQTPPIYGGQGLFSVGNPSGMVEQGNIDLSMRPTVKNSDGSISTVRSMGANIDGKEVLLPTVSNDGRIWSDDEAVNNYRQTGQHLGVFSSPEASTKYAEGLHNQQAGMYGNGPKLQQPAAFNGQTALQQPAQQIQEPTITQKNRTIKDVEKDIRKNYATRMQEAIKSGNINPTMLRQYMPQIQQQMNSEIEQARGDYKKSQGDAALQDVLSANGSAAQKKAFIKYAQATGNMDPATLKGLLSSNTQKYDDGANIHFYRTDNFGNPIDTGENGSPQPYFSIPKQVSVETRANQEFQAGENEKNRAAAAAARASSGGGGGNGLTSANLLALYKDATETVQEATGEFDINGRPVMTRRVKNPELAKRLQPIIDGLLPGGQSSQQQIDPRIAQARAAGYSDEEIQAFINGSPQPSTPNYASASQPIQPSNGLINVGSAPTFGSNNETLRDYAKNGTWLEDLRNYVGNKYGR
jgi:hypothetical protein